MAHPIHPEFDRLGVTISWWWGRSKMTRTVVRRSCLDKHCYSAKTAREIAAQLDGVMAYSCRFARADEAHWHVGHPPKGKALENLALAMRDWRGNLPTPVDGPRGTPVRSRA